MVPLEGLPVVVHYESASLSGSGFLMDCLEQTAKYNGNVVLLGSAIYQGILPQGVTFVDAAALENDRLRNFQRVYVDLAPYYANSLIFFRRLFLMEVFMRRFGYRHMILLDSDILVYQNMAEVEEFEGQDFACCVDENQHFSPGDTQGLRWLANCGISYWTLPALDDFLSFLQDAYENHLDRLRVKYDYHVAHSIPGGVTEMSLLYLWIQDRPRMRFYNMAVPRDGRAFNSTMWGDVNYSPGECVVDGFTRMKKVTIPADGGLPVFYLKAGGTLRMRNLHFVGSAKNCMHDYRVYGRLTFKTRWKLFCREWLLHGLLVMAHGNNPFSRAFHRFGRAVKKLLKKA